MLILPELMLYKWSHFFFFLNEFCVFFLILISDPKRTVLLELCISLVSDLQLS